MHGLMMCQILAPFIPAQSTNPVEVSSVFDFVIKGGPMMVPIILCSLVTITVIVERLVSLRRANIIPPEFVGGLATAWNDGGAASAMTYCRKSPCAIAEILTVAIKRLGEPIELLERHVQEAGQREVAKLQRFLRILAVIAAIAPLLGLLGTIFGMISAFQNVAVSGEALGKTELLAEGIYEALITTAAGLMVAIPSLIGYHGITARIESRVTDLDRVTLDFIETRAIPPNASLHSARAAESTHARESDRIRRPSGNGEFQLAPIGGGQDSGANGEEITEQSAEPVESNNA